MKLKRASAQCTLTSPWLTLPATSNLNWLIEHYLCSEERARGMCRAREKENIRTRKIKLNYSRARSAHTTDIDADTDVIPSKNYKRIFVSVCFFSVLFSFLHLIFRAVEIVRRRMAMQEKKITKLKPNASACSRSRVWAANGEGRQPRLECTAQSRVFSPIWTRIGSSYGVSVGQTNRLRPGYGISKAVAGTRALNVYFISFYFLLCVCVLSLCAHGVYHTSLAEASIVMRWRTSIGRP